MPRTRRLVRAPYKTYIAYCTVLTSAHTTAGQEKFSTSDLYTDVFVSPILKTKQRVIHCWNFCTIVSLRLELSYSFREIIHRLAQCCFSKADCTNVWQITAWLPRRPCAPNFIFIAVSLWANRVCYIIEHGREWLFR